MSYRRFFKKCEEFSICGVMGEAADIDMDGAMDNNTIYHIVIKGKGRLGTPFDDTSILMSYDKNNFIDWPILNSSLYKKLDREKDFISNLNDKTDSIKDEHPNQSGHNKISNIILNNINIST